MTTSQAISSSGKVVTDKEFTDPTVQPVADMGGYVDVLYSNQYVAQATGATVNLSGLQRYTHLLILVNVKTLTGTSPSIQFNFQLLDAFGGGFTVWSITQTTAAFLIHGIGPGSDSVAPVPAAAALAFTITGTTPAITFDVTIFGKVG